MSRERAMTDGPKDEILQVVDDRPALQQRILVGLVRKKNAVRALPNRHFADVTDEDIAISPARPQ